MNKIEQQNDIDDSKRLINSLHDLLVTRPDYADNAGLKDITDVLVQVHQTIDTNKYPERLISKLVAYIYSMGPAHKIYFPKEQEAIINELGVIAQKAGNTGLYYASTDTKADFFKGL